jgi:integrase
MAPLRALLQTAVEAGALRANPAAAMRLPAPKRSPQRKHLEPDELARLHEAVPEDWRSFVRLLAYTGARIGEFVELRWADLDLEEGTLTISRRRYRGEVDAPKSAYGVRRIPLTRDLVLDLGVHRLTSSWAGDDDPVFPSGAGRLHHPSSVARRVFKPAAARAGVPRASFKTLRDTCGTLQAHEGRHAEEIQRGWDITRPRSPWTATSAPRETSPTPTPSGLISSPGVDGASDAPKLTSGSAHPR